ncbi:neuraminidase-like domain-containing protein [Achromobacter sp.]|uniref:neuraminidase-like domain-containing protein n=1 Tax=Achromobacter sp. TaxID=134375 RepID=UPI003C71CDD5
MDSHDEILKRLKVGNNGNALTLADIMSLSPAQLRNLAAPRLTRAETETLINSAKKAHQENTVFESRLLSRANPQLTQLAHLGVTPLQEERGYTGTFERRAESYVAPGSVSSMFSPAAYLTELYREASPLHQDTSAYYLKKRRPDLGKLLLSQANMDTEVSTLTLSNEILMDNIANHHSWSPEQVTETLSTYRLSGNTPYHSPFEAVRQSILQQDPGLSVLAHSPHFSTQLPPQLLMAMVMAMPPELLNILTEAITDNNTETLYQKNFGTLSVEHLSSVSNLAHYYDLSMKEITTLTSLMAPAHTHLKNTLDSVAIDSDGQTKNIAIIEKSGSQLNYAHLVPLMGGGFEYEFSVKETIPAASTLRIVHDTTGYSSDHVYFEQLNLIPQKNTRTRVPLAMLDEHLYENPLKIGFLRERPENGTYYYSVSTYTTDLPIKRSLLYLNKLIRLYKALGISLSDMERFLLHTGSQTVISEAFLTSSAYAKFLSQQYGIPLDSTLMFCGIDIGTQSTPELSSQFDLLFNTPPLNGQTFALGGAVIEVDPSKLDSADSFRRAVLKRAWQVDDAGLYQMHLIGSRTATAGINNTLTDLSDLYRIALLAQTHALTIDELNTLLLLSPYRATKLYGIDEPTLKALTQYLYFTTEWLAQQKWSVYQLFVMATDIYSTVWTPALGSLQQTLLNGLGEQASLHGDTLITAMAPFIASSLHLNTSSLAESILLWANQIKPSEQTVDSFWSQIQKETPTETERNNIIAYAQVLAQLSAIVNTVNISEQELALLVKDPALLSPGMTALGLNVGILQQVTLFHRWINGSGAYVDDVLTALNNGTLSAELLANSLQDEVTRVKQAMAQAVRGNTPLTHWDDVYAVIQWLKMSATLHITPDSVADLMALTYDSATPYATWSSLGDVMLGGLDSQRSEAVKSSLDEQLSGALSAYYIREVSAISLGSREALYSHLLIDNQVSAQVKTSRLAEAIASVQLYVHRTLNGQETDADTAVLTRQFFVDWDTYNARYSTWAGVSQLVYYPENYVDPTLRVGQTAMLDKMLQQISQSTLSSDGVELGVLDYLTAFDEIANLDVVSGYHDNIDVNQGLSYFVSSSQTEPKKFYWRSVDHSKGILGGFPANAWSEWREITCAITPWDMIIRPVLLNSRLLISWVERTDQVSNDGTTASSVYTLKLSRINYDGGWSSPFSYDVTAIIHRVLQHTNEVGMFFSEYQGNGMLIVYFYEKDSEDVIPSIFYANGFYIHADMSRHDVDMSSENEAEKFSNIRRRTYFTLDKLSVRKVNNTYTDRYLVDLTFANSEENNDYDLVGDFSSATSTDNSGSRVGLNISPIIDLSYKKNIKAKPNDDSILNIFSKENEQFVIYDISFEYVDANQGDDKHVGAVITIENNQLVINTSSSYMDYRPPTGYPRIVLHFSDTASTYSIPEPSEYFNDIAHIHYRSYKVPEGKLSLDKARSLKEIRFHHKDPNDDSSIFSIYTSNPKACVSFSPENITFSATTKDNPFYAITAQDGCNLLPNFSRTKTMRYAFTEIALDVTDDFSWEESVTIPCNLYTVNIFGIYAEVAVNIILTRMNIDLKNYISLNKTPSGSLYMQQSVYRTRLNTLFATQLISKASAGLDAIFSMDTQLLPEPKLGEGTYVTLELGKYDSSIHGSSHEFTIEYTAVYSGLDRFPLSKGLLSDTKNTVTRFFVPRIDDGYDAPDDLYLRGRYQKSSNLHIIRLSRADVTNPDGWRLDTSYNGGTFPGLVSVYGLTQSTEPMDFNGANALYFWELFYYTPLMVHARLLQEVQYDEALSWLKYIWSPTGYMVHGEL